MKRFSVLAVLLAAVAAVGVGRAEDWTFTPIEGIVYYYDEAVCSYIHPTCYPVGCTSSPGIIYSGVEVGSVKFRALGFGTCKYCTAIGEGTPCPTELCIGHWNIPCGAMRLYLAVGCSPTDFAVVPVYYNGPACIMGQY